MNNIIEVAFDFNSMPLIGHITLIDYDFATILSHDYHVANASFIPKGCFLLIHVEPPEKDKLNGEKSTVILVRVNGISHDNAGITETQKLQTVQRIVNPEHNAVDIQKELGDPINQNKLSFYKLNCKQLGTFYESDNKIVYGSDVYNFSVAYIYKVYKPMGKALEYIVNYTKEDRLKITNSLLSSIADKPINIPQFDIGYVRYASTRLNDQEITNQTKVRINPGDFIKQKTGVFGMTRTGKSNTVKIIAKSIMDLSKTINIPIGQLIYDINGEYANNNEQNEQISSDNLYTVDINSLTHNNFEPSLNNFYLSPNYGLEIIKQGIKLQEKGSNYLNVFLSIKDVLESPILFILWISLLHKSTYEFPIINDDGSFMKGGDLIYFKLNNFIIFNIQKQEFQIRLEGSAFDVFKNNDLLQYFDFDVDKKTIKIQEQHLDNFLKKYLKQKYKKDNDKWTLLEHPLYNIVRNLNLDNELHYFSLLGFILQEDRTSGSKLTTSGWQMIVSYTNCHCKFSHKDYRDIIYQKLILGKTIIIDLSIGDPYTRKYIADELMQYIFEQQISIFRTGKYCPIINLFIEEAHNVIGKNAAIDSLWPRIAKEGAKYNIGVIYATQEPSAIHDAILSNTANFIVAHLNNEQEINTISSYEDIGDFANSIKKSEDVGFVRIRLLSKPYTIPVQINKYE